MMNTNKTWRRPRAMNWVNPNLKPQPTPLPQPALAHAPFPQPIPLAQPTTLAKFPLPSSTNHTKYSWRSKNFGTHHRQRNLSLVLKKPISPHKIQLAKVSPLKVQPNKTTQPKLSYSHSARSAHGHRTLHKTALSQVKSVKPARTKIIAKRRAIPLKRTTSKNRSCIVVQGVAYTRTGNHSLTKSSSTAASRTPMARNALRCAHALMRSKLRKKKTLCIYFSKFGRCDKGAACPHLHDRTKVTVCRQFLLGKCDKPDCPLSHILGEGNPVPVCKHYLNGLCVRPDCPYQHVKLSETAPVCKDFLTPEGCPLGAQCKHRHVYEQSNSLKHNKGQQKPTVPTYAQTTTTTATPAPTVAPATIQIRPSFCF